MGSETITRGREPRNPRDYKRQRQVNNLANADAANDAAVVDINKRIEAINAKNPDGKPRIGGPSYIPTRQYGKKMSDDDLIKMMEAVKYEEHRLGINRQTTEPEPKAETKTDGKTTPVDSIPDSGPVPESVKKTAEPIENVTPAAPAPAPEVPATPAVPSAPVVPAAPPAPAGSPAPAPVVQPAAVPPAPVPSGSPAPVPAGSPAPAAPVVVTPAGPVQTAPAAPAAAPAAAPVPVPAPTPAPTVPGPVPSPAPTPSATQNQSTPLDSIPNPNSPLAWTTNPRNEKNPNTASNGIEAAGLKKDGTGYYTDGVRGDGTPIKLQTTLNANQGMAANYGEDWTTVDAKKYPEATDANAKAMGLPDALAVQRRIFLGGKVEKPAGPTGIKPGEGVSDIKIGSDGIKGQGAVYDKNGKLDHFDPGYKEGQVVGTVRKANDFEKAGEVAVSKARNAMLKDPKYGYKPGYGFATPEQEASFNKDIAAATPKIRATENDKAIADGAGVGVDPLNMSQVPTNKGVTVEAERNGETTETTIKGQNFQGERTGIAKNENVMGSFGKDGIQIKGEYPRAFADAAKRVQMNTTPSVDNQREILREELNHAVQNEGGAGTTAEKAAVTDEMRREFLAKNPGYAAMASEMDPAKVNDWLNKEITVDWGGSGNAQVIAPNAQDRITSGVKPNPTNPTGQGIAATPTGLDGLPMSRTGFNQEGNIINFGGGTGTSNPVVAPQFKPTPTSFPALKNLLPEPISSFPALKNLLPEPISTVGNLGNAPTNLGNSNPAKLTLGGVTVAPTPEPSKLGLGTQPASVGELGSTQTPKLPVVKTGEGAMMSAAQPTQPAPPKGISLVAESVLPVFQSIGENEIRNSEANLAGGKATADAIGSVASGAWNLGKSAVNGISDMFTGFGEQAKKNAAEEERKRKEALLGTR